MTQAANSTPTVAFTPAAFEIKRLTEDGQIEGFASIYSTRDQGYDVVQPGAFAASLEGGRPVKMLWQHDPREPIGVWTKMEDRDEGLFAVGKVLPEVKKGAEALTLLRAGAVDGLSIGYRATRVSFGEDEDGAVVRFIEEAKLFEVSVVTFPMHEETRVVDVKNLASVRDVEHLLRDAGVPSRFAGLVAKYGFEGATKRLRADHCEGDAEARAQVDDLLTKLQRLKETLNA